MSFTPTTLIESVDDFFFDWIFQPMSDAAQVWCGVDCFGLARGCAGCFWVCTVIRAIIRNSLSEYTMATLWMLWLLATCFLKIPLVRSCLTPDAMNGLRVEFVGRATRVFVVWLSTFLGPFASKPTAVGCAFFIGFIYFIACTPLPPSRSKLRKALDWMGSAWHSILPQSMAHTFLESEGL